MFRQELDRLKADLNIRTGKRDQIVEQIAKLVREIDSLNEDITMWERTRVLLQKTGEQARAQAKGTLENIVTTALQHVFGPDYSFVIELDEVRGQPAAEFYVLQRIGDTVVRARPQDSQGGGVVDIVSLALRIAILQVFNDPALRGPIILDEPGKHVDEDSAIKLAGFLRHISKAFGRQIIMVTHQQHLAQVADRTFEVQIVGDASKVTVRSGASASA